MSSKITKLELQHWIALNQITAIGPMRWQRLLNYFPNLQTAWTAPGSELLRAGLEPKVVNKFLDQRPRIDPAQELEKVEKRNLKILTWLDPDYPPLLKEIYAPPPLLYYQGQLNLKNEFTLAVVGSRKVSWYGRRLTEELAAQLALAGLTIVSGLALGVDGIAHQAAVDAQAKTIAVLGCGLDQIYPRANQCLAENIIASNGAVISEFPLGLPPLKPNFPQRNRIIAGLSLGVLVTEATLDSGALITARYALEQNREVFAVPGSIYQPQSQGTNNLIKLGAKLVADVNDIIETLHLQQVQTFKQVRRLEPETPTEKLLINLLANGPLAVDKLVQLARLDISTINAALTMMEMKGLIKNIGNQAYLKI